MIPHNTGFVLPGSYGKVWGNLKNVKSRRMKSDSVKVGHLVDAKSYDGTEMD